jgi:NADPH2:quinone reductase
MKGILVEKNGGPEVLHFKELSLEKPGPGQARIKLMAAGLNFIDIYQRRGTYPVQLPYTPGLEGSGVVEEIGPNVTSVKVGDRVAYTSQPGAYAEGSLVKADSLIPLPENFSFEQGAAFPLQGMTAHYLIHEFRKPQKGDTVLIHAAAGGMGLLLVQWAKHLGARVFGTVSTEEKAKAARDAGADEIIFYNKENFADATKRLTKDEGVQLIIDGVGKTTFAGNLEAAARRGTVVLFGSASGPADPISPNALQAKSLTVAGGSLGNYLLNRDELLYRANDVLNGIKEGWLKLRIDHVLPLAKAEEAHTLLETRKSIGKIILKSDN